VKDTKYEASRYKIFFNLLPFPLFGPNILLSTLFSNTPSQFFKGVTPAFQLCDLSSFHRLGIGMVAPYVLNKLLQIGDKG